jgi:hypothetical protein
MGDLFLDRKILLKCDIKKLRVTVQSEFNWLRNIPPVHTVINLPVPVNPHSNFIN